MSTDGDRCTSATLRPGRRLPGRRQRHAAPQARQRRRPHPRRSGRILLVDPTYKPDWDLPGGMSEANEPPAETVRRELNEELDLDLHVGRLLCVDWVSPHGPWDDSLMFVFDGGTLSHGEIVGLQARSTANCEPSSSATRRTLQRGYARTSGGEWPKHSKR